MDPKIPTKNHAQTRHPDVSSCKNSEHFKFTWHGRKNQEVGQKLV